MNYHATTDLMSKSEFARHCGVKPASITLMTKPGKRLVNAMNGRYIDAIHPDAVAYLKAHGGKLPPPVQVNVAPAAQAPARVSSGMPSQLPVRKSAQLAPVKKPHVRGWAAKNAKNAVDVNITFDAQSNPEDFLDMTLRELTTRFGTDRQFLEWLKAVKSIEDIREKRLKNAERENQYLPRDMVQMVVSEFVRCFNLQLTDGSKTIATQVRNMTKAGQGVEACIAYVERRLGSPIADAKKRIADHLADRDIEI